MASSYNKRSLRLIVVDSDRGSRLYVKRRLSADGIRVIGEAENTQAGLRLIRGLQPDIVLLDLIMPGMDGVEATRRIKQVSPRTQVVVLTSYHEDIHIFPALKAGAIAYILKDMKMEKLVEVLHRALQGEVTLHPRVAMRVLQNIRGEDSDDQPLFTDLTDREQDVLKLIASGMTALGSCNRPSSTAVLARTRSSQSFSAAISGSTARRSFRLPSAHMLCASGPSSGAPHGNSIPRDSRKVATPS